MYACAKSTIKALCVDDLEMPLRIHFTSQFEESYSALHGIAGDAQSCAAGSLSICLLTSWQTRK